jgi:hypothetical protein
MCSAIGTPTPNITWVRLQGVSMVIKSQGVGNAILNIPNITRHESGTYRCIATNNPNEMPVTMETTVFVMCKCKKNQFAYRSGGSCTNALISLQHNVLQSRSSTL